MKTGHRLYAIRIDGEAVVVTLDDAQRIVFEDFPPRCSGCRGDLADSAYPVLQGASLKAVDCVDCGMRFGATTYARSRDR